jgi:hypothetical protein
MPETMSDVRRKRRRAAKAEQPPCRRAQSGITIELA